MENPKKGLFVQKAFYTVTRILFGWLFRLILHYRHTVYKPKADAFLLLGNHSMEMDPFLAVITTRRHMRFVASANIMRGLGGFFVRFLAGPIPRYKGAPADNVIEAVKENLAAGVSVAMYPEGNTTWDGESGFISRRTAELVKESTGALITFTIAGGFFRKPRWAKYKKRGPVYGHVVGEYSRQQLDAMSVDEILALIRRDLYVNAYDEQEKRHWKYTGKKLAEGMEASVYTCPCCGQVGHMHSREDRLFCDCGAEWRYTTEGYLEKLSGAKDAAEGIAIPAETAEGGAGDALNFTTILDWCRWQKQYLHAHAEELKAQTAEPICSIDRIHIYGDRLEMDGESAAQPGTNPALAEQTAAGREVFRWDEITKLSLFRATRLFFTLQDGSTKEFFVDPKNGRVGQIFYALWRICTDREYV